MAAIGLINKMNQNEPPGIKDLTALIKTLRGVNGCPWDRKQTPRSIVLYLIEEVFELAEAIESGNSDAVLEELGDVLFQVLFITVLFNEKACFNLNDVIQTNITKMIRRHPHVFGDSSAQTVDAIKKQWYAIKRAEKGPKPDTSVLDSVPDGLPALMRAARISARAVDAGFDWDDIKGVMQKAEEEWREFQSELGDGEQTPDSSERVLMEFGDLMFTLVNVARFARIHPEAALRAATQKFEKRFKKMEKTLLQKERNLDSLSRDEIDRLWEDAKKSLDKDIQSAKST